GENVSDFRWFGGHFTGHVFDNTKGDNPWEPNANTRAILIITTPGGHTENLTFRDVTSDGLAGAVITVLGAEKKGSEREVETFARNVTVENCTLERSGKFMWDYGYLWQITVWPEDYSDAERVMATKYFRNDLVRGPVRMKADDERVFFDNSKPLPISKKREGAEAERGHDTVCFFGDSLPSNLVRGRQYFVIETTPEFIRIAEKVGGEAIKFASDAGPQARLISHLFQAHLALYAPAGSGPGKGALDLVGCENVIVRGSRFSALGDTMHIQKSRGITFANNHITGSRMGAFFIAEFCKNATITGNTVDGTNGSRVISVEKSCEDVTIIGNTFRNGGRGSWINQPRNFVLADNIFVNNTTKCERDPRRGRRSFLTGEYERYSELYFTTHEPGGRYGNVTVRGNIFTSGPNAEHAISFAPGGDTILVVDNIFSGPVRDILPAVGCENVTLRGNMESAPNASGLGGDDAGNAARR
ncbi:MAG: right-handed parallel beta-helix repeat-containing protein, partial [Proteobacteria bacterium]|nr:right-handed parallel beta-helix repeat-containing protein [Pseudomonadota bacterium]